MRPAAGRRARRGRRGPARRWPAAPSRRWWPGRPGSSRGASDRRRTARSPWRAHTSAAVAPVPSATTSASRSSRPSPDAPPASQAKSARTSRGLVRGPAISRSETRWAARRTGSSERGDGGQGGDDEPRVGGPPEQCAGSDHDREVDSRQDGDRDEGRHGGAEDPVDGVEVQLQDREGEDDRERDHGDGVEHGEGVGQERHHRHDHGDDQGDEGQPLELASLRRRLPLSHRAASESRQPATPARRTATPTACTTSRGSSAAAQPIGLWAKKDTPSRSPGLQRACQPGDGGPARQRPERPAPRRPTAAGPSGRAGPPRPAAPARHARSCRRATPCRSPPGGRLVGPRPRRPTSTRRRGSARRPGRRRGRATRWPAPPGAARGPRR